jgi:hypothetical protein
VNGVVPKNQVFYLFLLNLASPAPFPNHQSTISSSQSDKYQHSTTETSFNSSMALECGGTRRRNNQKPSPTSQSKGEWENDGNRSGRRRSGRMFHTLAPTITFKVQPHHKLGLPRRHEVTLNRLRLNHAYANEYKNKRFGQDPSCRICGDNTESVADVLLECLNLVQIEDMLRHAAIENHQAKHRNSHIVRCNWHRHLQPTETAQTQK